MNYTDFEQLEPQFQEVEETEYTNDTVDEVLENEPENYNIDDVLQRFEQAKLYSTLLKHKLFSEGSADSETISIVESEIKNFVVKRMRVLMGVEQEQVTNIKVEQQFTEVEAHALKSIANRLIEKQSVQPEQPKEPKLNQVMQNTTNQTVQTVTIKPVQSKSTAPQSPVNKTTKPQKPVGRPPKQQKTKTIVIKEPTPEDGNKGSDGTNYSQAAPPLNRIPMPSPTEMAAHAAASAMKNSSSFEQGNSALSKLLGIAVKDSMVKNKDVED